MTMNARSPSTLRRHPGFVRDHDWTINGPAVGPEQTPRWPTDDKRTPTDRRHSDIEWPVDERRTPRVPVPVPAVEEDDFPYISSKQPATCWLI